MADDRDVIPEDEIRPEDQVEAGENYALLSAQEFDQVLEALGPESEMPSQEEEDGQELEPYAQLSAETGRSDNELAPLADDERLRQPRAQLFRQRVRNQVGMFPLALWLLALGGFLIARQQHVDGLPDLSNRALVVISFLSVSFSTLFYAFVGGRRDRGLVFIGMWAWSIAGLLAVLIYGIDKNPDAAEWWPLLLWSLGLALIFTYLFERTHDARLVLFSVLIFVAGGAAFAVTSDRIDQDVLDKAADYWPLLLSVLGIGMLPLAFRRRTG
jgi:hypothetical protein